MFIHLLSRYWHKVGQPLNFYGDYAVNRADEVSALEELAFRQLRMRESEDTSVL